MGITSTLSDLAQKALALHSELSVMSMKYSHLEKEFKRLVESHEKFVAKSSERQQELLLRVGQLEATFDSAFRASIKEAAFQLARERMEMNPGERAGSATQMTSLAVVVEETCAAEMTQNGRAKRKKKTSNRTKRPRTPK